MRGSVAGDDPRARIKGALDQLHDEHAGVDECVSVAGRSGCYAYVAVRVDTRHVTTLQTVALVVDALNTINDTGASAR